MNPQPTEASWRAQLRARLIAAREALPAAERAAKGREIEARLRPFLDTLPVRILGFCWPFHGEFDARPLVVERLARGWRACLPVVVSRYAPLAFREWTPAAEMVDDRYGIHIPAAGESLRPEAILMPLNAFDRAGYRLGYGGGYFDRTLAVLEPRLLAIGVGFELARVDSVRPQPHDQRLDAIVTEAGVFVVGEAHLA